VCVCVCVFVLKKVCYSFCKIVSRELVCLYCEMIYVDLFILQVLLLSSRSLPSLEASSVHGGRNCSVDHTAVHIIGNSSIDTSVTCDTQRP